MSQRRNSSKLYVGFCVLITWRFHLLCSALPQLHSLRSAMVHYYEQELKDFTVHEEFRGNVTITDMNGCKGQNLCATNGMIRTMPGIISYYNHKAESWRSWQPASRLVNYVLDFDWNNPEHTRELKLYLVKYATLSLALWYVLSIIRHYFKKQQKQYEHEQIILLIKNIEAQQKKKTEEECGAAGNGI